MFYEYCIDDTAVIKWYSIYVTDTGNVLFLKLVVSTSLLLFFNLYIYIILHVWKIYKHFLKVILRQGKSETSFEKDAETDGAGEHYTSKNLNALLYSRVIILLAEWIQN